MASKRWLLLSVLLASPMAACLVSFDDYPLGDTRTRVSAAGDSASAGRAGNASNGNGGTTSSAGGTPASGGQTTQGGEAGATECRPSGRERCDGIDNDCNAAVDDASACPMDCRGAARAGKGYMFCTAPKAKTSASSACSAQDMQLVVIENADENAWLFARVQEFQITVNLFTAAADSANEGHWVWPGGLEFWNGAADGNAVAGLFNNWDVSQPNNSDEGNGEDCALLQMKNGRWNDQACDDAYAYICEQN